ncbi:MAG: hypothetical protein ACHQNV_09005 [Vicinamibacteria bacterium]
MGKYVMGGAVLVLAAAATVHAGAPPELERAAFLLGSWSGSGAGQPGEGSGEAEFVRGLQDRVILRRSHAEYPAAPGRAAFRHDDLMVIYPGAEGALRADYYDNEGHVIRYVVDVPAADRAVFVSEAAAGAPRFRLSYALEATGVLRGQFEIAAPDAPQAFKPYLAWESRKKP